MQLHVGMSAAGPRRPNERDHHGIGHVKRVDQYALALLQLGGKSREPGGELVETWIDNHEGANNDAPSRVCKRKVGTALRAVLSSSSIRRSNSRRLAEAVPTR